MADEMDSAWLIERIEPGEDGRPLWLQWEGEARWTPEPNEATKYDEAKARSYAIGLSKDYAPSRIPAAAPCRATEHVWLLRSRQLADDHLGGSDE